MHSLFITIYFNVEHIRNVCNWYKQSFAQLRQCGVPSDPEKEAIFAKIIESIYERHSPTLITMAKGAHEIRTILKQDVETFAGYQDIQKRMDDFYMSRIGIRMVTINIKLKYISAFYHFIIDFYAFMLVDWSISCVASTYHRSRSNRSDFQEIISPRYCTAGYS